jgi:hypothetical protein
MSKRIKTKSRKLKKSKSRKLKKSKSRKLKKSKKNNHKKSIDGIIKSLKNYYEKITGKTENNNLKKEIFDYIQKLSEIEKQLINCNSKLKNIGNDYNLKYKILDDTIKKQNEIITSKSNEIRDLKKKIIVNIKDEDTEDDVYYDALETALET